MSDLWVKWLMIEDMIFYVVGDVIVIVLEVYEN